MALAEYGNALNIDTDGSGNPILVDPDSGDTIAIYDRASGGWQVTEIEAATGDFDSVNTESLPNIKVEHLDGRDPQTVVDNLEPYTRLVGDPTNTHTLSSPLVVSTEGVQLHGLNLRLADGANDGLIEFRADHGGVRHCRLDGNEANQDSGTAIGEYVNGITVTDCVDVTVEKNEVLNCRDQGILVSSLYQVENNNIEGASVSDVTVHDNTVDNVRNGAILFQGGQTGESAEIGRAINNTCRNFANEGVQVIDGFQDAIVKDNDITADGSAGLAIENHSGRGVERPVKNVDFSSNTVETSGTGADGLNVKHPAYPFEDVTVKNNWIKVNGDGSTGIKIGISGTQTDGFEIVDNTLIGPGKTTSLHAIQHRSPASGVIVVNNTIREWKSAFRKQDVDVDTDVKINGNSVTDVQDGFTVVNVPGLVVTDNTINNISGRGIVANADNSETIERTLITDNSISGDGSSGVSGILPRASNGTHDYYLISDNTMVDAVISDFAGGANALINNNIER